MTRFPVSLFILSWIFFFREGGRGEFHALLNIKLCIFGISIWNTINKSINISYHSSLSVHI